jgi:hypothetical protein
MSIDADVSPTRTASTGREELLSSGTIRRYSPATTGESTSVVSETG